MLVFFLPGILLQSKNEKKAFCCMLGLNRECTNAITVLCNIRLCCNVLKSNHKDLKYLTYLFLDVIIFSKHSGDFRTTLSHSKFNCFH